MLTVSRLSKSFGSQTLFEEASFQIAPGERVGLVGRNGHGKSTLFRILLDIEHQDSGTVSVPSGYRIGHLAQHLVFPHADVVAEAASALPHHEDGVDETYKAKAVLSGLGFSETLQEADPNILSGGFQVRLDLAKVLLSEPDLLLLDEPTNHLDIVSIRWLRRFLLGWKGALMLITHDRDFMDSVTTHTIAIHRERIRKMVGGTAKLYDQIVTEEEIHEKTRANDEKKRADTQKFIDRFRAQATKARAVQSRIKALARHERLDRLSDVKDLDFRFDEAPFLGKWMLEAKDLSFAYDPSAPLITDLSFSVSKGDRLAVVGPNGRGKTTLLRLLAGDLNPTGGSTRTMANVSVGYFGQTNVERLNPRLTVEEEVRSSNLKFSRTQVRSLCGAMMFEGASAEKKIGVLSGGEKSRVLLAKLLASPLNLILLDEPTNHLDQESVDAFIEAVDAFEGAVVVVSHVERLLSSLASRLLVFDGGEVALHEMGYSDFLEKIGWKDEAGSGKGRKGGKSPLRGDARRQRAEIVNRRSKELGNLQKRLERLEGEIVGLEDGIPRDEEALVAASMRGDGAAVRDLSAKTTSSRARIEEAFEVLTALSAEMASKEKEYDRELATLGDEPPA